MTVTYTAVGSVRGSCGHAHRTAIAAHRCAVRDHHAVRVGRAAVPALDRVVVRSDGKRLSEREVECLDVPA